MQTYAQAIQLKKQFVSAAFSGQPAKREPACFLQNNRPQAVVQQKQVNALANKQETGMHQQAKTAALPDQLNTEGVLQRVVHGSFDPANYGAATSHVNISGIFRGILGLPVGPPNILHSQILRENLTLFGGVPDSNNDPEATGNQAHHIVEMNDPHALPARQLLILAGIDLNSAINGVLLPTAIGDDTGEATVHIGSHVQGYAANVNLSLDNAINNDAYFAGAGITAAGLRGGHALTAVELGHLRTLLTNQLAALRTFLLTHHIAINKGYKMDEDYDDNEERRSRGKKDKWGHSGGKPLASSFRDGGMI